MPVLPAEHGQLSWGPARAQFSDCVVSVARKTDASLWPPLFAAVGPASQVLEGLLQAGALHRAACTLLVVDCLEGPSSAHALALRLMQVSGRRSGSPLWLRLWQVTASSGMASSAACWATMESVKVYGPLLGVCSAATASVSAWAGADTCDATCLAARQDDLTSLDAQNFRSM